MNESKTLFSAHTQSVEPRFFYKETGATRQNLSENYYQVTGTKTINQRKLKQ